MYAQSRGNYYRQWQELHHARRMQKIVKPLSKRKRIARDLRVVGISKYGLLKQEARYLPKIIKDDERIGGVVYGHNKGNSIMLVATDRRVIFLDKKPLFVEEDEARYKVVSGVDISTNGIGATVTLHTRIKDYKVRTLNQRSAIRFVNFIESMCMHHQEEDLKGEAYD